jgi:hypothetical protein
MEDTLKRSLNEDDAVRLAEAAGLHKALAHHRQDVLGAAKAAMAARNAFLDVEDPALEPCPALRVGSDT